MKSLSGGLIGYNNPIITFFDFIFFESPKFRDLREVNGGQGGIRTLGTVTSTHP